MNVEDDRKALCLYGSPGLFAFIVNRVWLLDLSHLSHVLNVIHRAAIFVDAELEEVAHWVAAFFFDVGILAEIAVCFEQFTGVNALFPPFGAVMQNKVACAVELLCFCCRKLLFIEVLVKDVGVMT